MPHLLFLAWGFPPSRAGGVYRALATANAFADAGWRVTVVTARREDFARYTGTDASLEGRVHPGVEVVRIPFRWPAQDTDVRRYPALRALLPPLWHRWRRALDRMPFPEPSYGPWLRPLTAAALDVHRHSPVDLVVATANPHVTFGAADALHRAHGVPYVMDYRDAWTLDVFSGRRLARPRSRVGRLESRLLNAAREAWFVNEPLRRWHAERHPAAADRMRTVANGWDPELFDVPEPRTSTPGAPLRFAYLGTVTPKVPLPELLAGWQLALERGLLPAGSALDIAGHLGYFATPQGQLAQTISEAREHGVRFTGAVPKAEVAAFYRDADVLVLALGSGRYVTSGKVYEYVAAGRPVVAVHDPGNATTDVLTEHPLCARVARVDADEVAGALGRAARMAVEAGDEEHARVAALAARYRRDQQLAPRVAALTAAVGGATAGGATSGVAAAGGAAADSVAGGGAASGAAAWANPGPAAEASPGQATAANRGPTAEPPTSGVDGDGPRVLLLAGDRATGDELLDEHALELAALGATVDVARLELGGRPSGRVGRVVSHLLVGTRSSLAVDADLRERARTADVVVAADRSAVGAVWRLRRSGTARLVNGVPAALGVLSASDEV